MARLVYQITVTDPGSKNQGWHGVLFDKDGKPMQVEPGKMVSLAPGVFVSVAQTNSWTPYGMVHADMVRWMKTENGNVIMDSEPWSYLLFVDLEGSKSEGWRGELRHGRGIVGEPADDKPVATPMGAYRWIRNENLFGNHGWFHVSWSAAQSHKAA